MLGTTTLGMFTRTVLQPYIVRRRARSESVTIASNCSGLNERGATTTPINMNFATGDATALSYVDVLPINSR